MTSRAYPPAAAIAATAVFGIVAITSPWARAVLPIVSLVMAHLVVVGTLALTVDIGATSAARWWRTTLAAPIVVDLLTVTLLTAIAGGIGFLGFDKRGTPPVDVTYSFSIGDRGYYPTSGPEQLVFWMTVLSSLAMLIGLVGAIGSTRLWARDQLRLDSSATPSGTVTTDA